jgi:hypothetical protein
VTPRPKSSIASTRKIPGEHQLGPTEYTCVVGEPEQPSHCGTTGMRFPHGTERDGLPSPRYRLSGRSLTPRTGEARRGDLAAKKGPHVLGLLVRRDEPVFVKLLAFLASGAYARGENPVPAGSDVSAGAYRCRNGGDQIDAGSVDSLPPCPKCANAEWTRSGAATGLTTPIQTDSYAKARNYLLADRTVWLAE